jgi:hypothetical protein
MLEKVLFTSFNYGTTERAAGRETTERAGSSTTRLSRQQDNEQHGWLGKHSIEHLLGTSLWVVLTGVLVVRSNLLSP